MDKIIKVKEKEYKFRLTSWQIRQLEEREETGIMFIMTKAEESGRILEPIIKIMHAALQYYQKDMSLEQTYELYDDLVEHEKWTMDEFGDLVKVILETAGLSTRRSEEVKKK